MEAAQHDHFPQFPILRFVEEEFDAETDTIACEYEWGICMVVLTNQPVDGDVSEFTIIRPRVPAIHGDTLDQAFEHLKALVP